MKISKFCSKCNKKRFYKFFRKDKKSSDGLTYWCKTCLTKIAKDNKLVWKSRNPIYNRSLLLKRKYNITINDYNFLLEKQNSKCAICSSMLEDIKNNKNYFGKVNNFCIDHNHITGKNRGLLCRDCNLGLGKFKDNYLLLKSALNYLQKYDEQN